MSLLVNRTRVPWLTVIAAGLAPADVRVMVVVAVGGPPPPGADGEPPPQLLPIEAIARIATNTVCFTPGS